MKREDIVISYEKECKNNPDGGTHCFHTEYTEALYKKGNHREPVGNQKYFVCCWCGLKVSGYKKYYKKHGDFQPDTEQPGSSGYRHPDYCGHEEIE